MLIKYLTKMATVVLGLIVLAFGVIMYLKSGLGVDAFTVFYEGIAKTLHISVGTGLQICLVSLATVVLFIDKSRLGIGTLMHAVLTGFFIDLLMGLNIPCHQNIFIKIIALLAGVFLTGSGLAIYIKAGLGVGAIDAIMIIIHTKSKKDIKWVRIGIDFILAAAGYMLGGTLGLGTAAGVIFTGPVIEMMLKFINWIVLRVKKSSQLV